MKKKDLEKLSEIKEQMKLTKEVKNNIIKKVLKNFAIATCILLFFIFLMLIERNATEILAKQIYRILSMTLICITLIIMEIAYKKNSDSLAITSIEMLVLSLITLFTPYTLINKTNIYTSLGGVFFTVYYIIKSCIIYKMAKNTYLRETSDIPQIIKKESQDELAKEQLKKINQEERKDGKRGKQRKADNK